MTTRSKGPGAGFGWLKNGIGMIFRHPKPVLGGAGLLMLVSLVPALVTLPIQFSIMHSSTPHDPTIFIWIMAISTLVSLLIVPLYAGYLQLLDATERGLPARARDIFNPYRQGGEAGRLIGYGAAVMAMYFVMIAVIIVAAGGGVGRWYMQIITAQAHHQPPPAGFPQGFGITFALLCVFALFMMGFYAISLGQVALRRRSVFGAIGDGFVGALKNVLPLIVFVLSSLLAGIIVVIAFLIVALLIGLITALVGPFLVLVLVIPLELAMMLIMMAVMFGVVYYLWRDVCGEDSMTTEAPTIAV